MAIHKLDQVNAFIARDFEAEVPALGIVRAAPKILQGGAKELARAQTYQCALFGHKVAGASAGINAPVDEQSTAVQAFVAELLPQVTEGALMISPGKGVTHVDLAPLLAVDRRDPTVTSTDASDPIPGLTALSATAAAAAIRPLDGAAVAIEGFGETGLAIAERVLNGGARIVAISTASGTAVSNDGFSLASLSESWSAGGADLVKSLVDEPEPVWKIMGTACDVLFVGSKMGVLDHKAAEHVSAQVVVPHAPIPYTTKGAIMLGRQNVVVVPDIVATSGPMLAGLSTTDAGTPDGIESSVRELTNEIKADEAGPILAACKRAEAFLGTWREALPFGRPFAP